MNKRMLSTQNAEEFAVCIAMDAMRLSLGKKPKNGFTPEEIARWFSLMTTPPSDTSGEAVAWRCVQWVNGNSQSMVTEFRETAESRLSMGEEVEPLYPASALAAAEARSTVLREALEKIQTISLDEDIDDRDILESILETACEALSPAHKGSENV